MDCKIFTRGFTLVELLMALAIIVAISTVMLLNYNKVNSRISLENKANEIALWVREAQAYAMGIKTQGSSLYWSYGLYFNTTAQDSFIEFVDKNGDKLFTIGGTCGDSGSECVKQIPMPAGMKLDQLCLKQGASTEVCTLANVHITFTRPKPDALIRSGGTPYDQVRIRLMSPTGYCKRILVMNSGQVGIDQATCP